MPTRQFHPAVRHWFESTFESPTPAQAQAWAEIFEGHDTLISAPTGSGKTLAAFLTAIHHLIEEALSGSLLDQTRILYVSPLKALSNDIQKNLEMPLTGIMEQLAIEGLLIPPIRTKVRTGDTPASERVQMGKTPPHILVTTPESLYILLTSDSGRRMLAGVKTVIVDEIHAILESKRGAHLALSLERLERITAIRPQRIGLSATQNPIQRVAQFLTAGNACRIVDQGHRRSLDLSIEVPGLPLEAVLSGEQASDLYDRMAELIRDHRITLIFVNTRRLSERIARALSERIGNDAVTSHHGSLSKEQRLDAENRLKTGKIKALVATASLELGIDVGDVDLVCQFGSTHSIATFLQRVGRSGHFRGGRPKGRLFPTSRDDLIECIALIDAVRQGELDLLRIPEKPLDVLAQQIVAIVACEEMSEDELYTLVCRAHPYRDLSLGEFHQVIEMLASGYATSRGQRAAYLHRDQIHQKLRPRKAARLTAVTCGGAIPDNADYRVILEPQGEFIGTVDEDFAIESMAGDIFQLGNASWRVLRLDQGNLRVEDAHNLPPSIPFWFGEAPGRTHELSLAISRLRDELTQIFATSDDSSVTQIAIERLRSRLDLPDNVLTQAVNYLFIAYRTLRCLPTFETLIIERFFDEAGGMQLIIHAPLGTRANRAWGLALRKRFCRSFNFELQAAATEDAVLLSLGTSQSFDLAGVSRYLSSSSVRDILIQALLDAPMFAARWRWNGVCSLAIRRFQAGKKTPPYLVRMQSEDLVTAVFPDQLACLENIVGDREIPDHPLVNQTISDCLHDAMDIERLERVLQDIEEGKIQVEVRDLREPSPLAAEIINARAYSFLDGAPLEERRTRAVVSRRWLNPEEASDLTVLDPATIKEVIQSARPAMTNPDETHDALMTLGYLIDTEIEASTRIYLQQLQHENRAVRFEKGSQSLWFAAERIPWIKSVFGNSGMAFFLEPEGIETSLPKFLLTPSPTPEVALKDLLRARLGSSGPVTAHDLANPLGLSSTSVESALCALEAEGSILKGSFSADTHTEWCDRRLLARIHRTRVQEQRKKVVAVSGSQFMRFLFGWHRLLPENQPQGPSGLAAVLEQLEGYEAPARCWEANLLPARLTNYDPAWMDQLCLSGKIVWSRLRSPNTGTSLLRAAPIAFCSRRQLRVWQAQGTSPERDGLSAAAKTIIDCLNESGSLFFDEIAETTQLLPTMTEKGLGELVARGWVYSDGFSGLRGLLVPEQRRQKYRQYRFGLDEAGRWNLVQGGLRGQSGSPPESDLDGFVRTLLRRYGVLFKALLETESLMPPWMVLLPHLRRMEIRGDVRGGRFVAGAFGEQFALPEALEGLRRIQALPDDDHRVVLSASDPLCLQGIVTPGAKIPRIPGNRVLYQGGLVVGQRIGKHLELEEPEGPLAWNFKSILIRNLGPSSLKSYLE
jgi:ATP-dependent Lhr-like helicase